MEMVGIYNWMMDMSGKMRTGQDKEVSQNFFFEIVYA